MKDVVRKLMPYGILEIMVKDKRWLLSLMIIDPSRIPATKVYQWSDDLENGLKELLAKTQKEYHKILEKVEQMKRMQNMFGD